MPKQRTSRNRQREAECAAEHYLRVHCGCVNTVRAMRTRFARRDLFASDVLGKDSRGRLYAAQVTCGDHSNVAHRRRKMERVPWSINDAVLLLEFREERIGNRKHFAFRVHQYITWSGVPEHNWTVTSDLVSVPTEWFKAYRELERASA